MLAHGEEMLSPAGSSKFEKKLKRLVVNEVDVLLQVFKCQAACCQRGRQSAR